MQSRRSESVSYNIKDILYIYTFIYKLQEFSTHVAYIYIYIYMYIYKTENSNNDDNQNIRFAV